MKKILKLVQKEGLDDYVETSALNGVQDVDKVFTEAIRVAIGSDTLSTGEADDVDGNRNGNGTPSPDLLSIRIRRWLCLE